MKALINNFERNSRKRTLGSYAFLFSFMVLLTINIFGEPVANENSPPTTNDSIRTHQTWNGTTWVKTVQEDDSKAIAEAKKKAEHDTFMGYIYMGLGFLAVVAIALFTTLRKEKNGSNETNGNPSNTVRPAHKFGIHKRRR